MTPGDRFRVLLDKVDCRDIIGQHLDTLVHEKAGGQSTRSWEDYLLFFGVPLLFGAGIVTLGVRMSDNAINICTNALAILAGLLFNLLVVLHGLALPQSGRDIAKTARRLAKQIYSNISYSILVSLFALASLLLASNYSTTGRVRLVFGTISAVLILHFALTMGMVLKRMHVMLKQEFATEKKAAKSSAES